MGRPLTKTGSSLAHGAALALLTLGLVACGVTPQSTTEVTPPVPLSPAAGEIPEERTQASATITEDRLDPDRFAGQIETGFTLMRCPPKTGPGIMRVLRSKKLQGGRDAHEPVQ